MSEPIRITIATPNAISVGVEVRIERQTYVVVAQRSPTEYDIMPIDRDQGVKWTSPPEPP